MIETHSFESSGGADLIIEPHLYQGQRFSDGKRNLMVSARDLGGGSYTVSYRPPEAPNFIEHIPGATENDSVMLAGPEAPVFDAVKITFTGVPVAPAKQVVTLNIWPRGL
jgi:hypothetical protein